MELKNTPLRLRTTLPLLTALILFSCSGCALGHRVVALNYTPSTDTVAHGAGQVVSVAAIQDACPNPEVTAFADGREIGEIRNGWYVKTACVVSQAKDLGPWVTDALMKELARRGYQPVSVTSLPPTCPIGVSGSITECYSKMKVFGGQACTVAATVAIQKDGVAISTKQYVGHCDGGLALVTAEEYEHIFQAAMADLVSQVMQDIAEVTQ